MWEGAPARCSGNVTALRRTAAVCQYTRPIWLLETLNILMQVALAFLLVVLPAVAISWFARDLIPAGDDDLGVQYFRVTPLPDIVWHLTLYTFLTTWVVVVLTSILSCLYIRCTAAAPGLYPSRGLGAALLMHRMSMLNAIQRQWTWTVTGQYLRALAGMRFPRLGASECDVMFNLVPDVAGADSQVFFSNGCFTNMLDCGAEHHTLRRLDMPRNFFAGNNCVAECGNFPSNFLLGVSTPGDDIQFRRQMRSRLGEPITVAGNPPVKFASAAFEAENRTHELPGFPLFLTRLFLFDFFSIGMLRLTEVILFAIFFVVFLRWNVHPMIDAAVALALVEVALISLSVAVKRLLVGNEWGEDHATAFWSWKHFSYFFAQDCFFIWCRRTLSFSAGTILSNSLLRRMGCHIGRRTIVAQPMQCSDWNAVSFGDDCIADGFLQFHTFENMMLKVKRTHIKDGCTVAFGATVLGGAVIERGTTLQPLSLVLKEMTMLTGTYEGSPAEPVALCTAPAPVVPQAGGHGELPGEHALQRAEPAISVQRIG
jgi:hypothetical protein